MGLCLPPFLPVQGPAALLWGVWTWAVGLPCPWAEGLGCTDVLSWMAAELDRSVSSEGSVISLNPVEWWTARLWRRALGSSRPLQDWGLMPSQLHLGKCL